MSLSDQSHNVFTSTSGGRWGAVEDVDRELICLTSQVEIIRSKNTLTPADVALCAQLNAQFDELFKQRKRALVASPGDALERQRLRSGSTIIDYSNPLFDPSDTTHPAYKWCLDSRMHDFDANGKCQRCFGVKSTAASAK
jgi:hypothetical protein